MKKIFILFFALVLSPGLSAASLLASQLSQINKEWQWQSTSNIDVDKITLANNASSEDLIALHLHLVVQELKSRNTNNLSTRQSKNRNNLLTKLNAYANARTFPTNIYSPITQPIFIDFNNVHCAVGYLMEQSGSDNVAQAINQTQQFAYIRDIKNVNVDSWAKENGFTIDELAWIQPSYPYVGDLSPFTSGVNGEVNCLLTIDNNTILIGGNFSKTTTNINCGNLVMATRSSGSWVLQNFGIGSNGPVHCLYKDGSVIYIGGKFTQLNGVAVNNIAKFDLLTGALPIQAMPGIDSTVLCITKYKDTIFAGGYFADLISKWNGSQFVNGNNHVYGKSVRAFHEFENKLYIGGDFELPTGALRKNIVAYENGSFQSSGMGCYNIVNSFATFKNEIYAGCEFLDTDTNNKAVLVKWDSTYGWKILFSNVKNYTGFMGQRFKEIITINDKLVAVGKFIHPTDLMNISNNIIAFEMDGGILTPKLLYGVNDQCNTVLIHDNQYYFGGQFNTNLPNNVIANNLAKSAGIPMPIQPDRIGNSINIIPNPARNKINVTGPSFLSEDVKIYIFDNLGKLACNCKLNAADQSIDISNLNAGVYKLILLDPTSNQVFKTSFVKG